MWLFWALGNAFLFSVGQTLLKKGYKHFSAKATYFLNGVFCFGLWIVYALIRGEVVWSVGFWPNILYVLVPMPYIVYLQALKRGKVSLVSTVTSASPALVVFLAFLFLNERLLMRQIIVVFWVIGGVVLAGFSRESLRELKGMKSESWLLWALVATGAFAAATVIEKSLINEANLATFVFFGGIMNLIYALIWSLKTRANWERYLAMPKKQLWPTAIGVVLPNIAALAFFEALNLGKASLVAAVANVSLPLTVLWAYWFLKEKLTKWQILGIGMVVFGVILIS